jgi:hypothetical protein
MELLMIYKISPNPSLPKRGRERELFAKKGIFPPFGKGGNPNSPPFSKGRLGGIL